MIKNRILPITVIATLLLLLYFSKRNEDSKIRLNVCGKVFEYEVAANIQSYYNYKYYYNNKTYKGSKLIEKIDKSIIGKCFEVLIDSVEPSNSKLNLDKELDCECYTYEH